jgi:hypothetical protein
LERIVKAGKREKKKMAEGRDCERKADDKMVRGS